MGTVQGCDALRTVPTKHGIFAFVTFDLTAIAEVDTSDNIIINVVVDAGCFQGSAPFSANLTIPTIGSVDDVSPTLIAVTPATLLIGLPVIDEVDPALRLFFSEPVAVSGLSGVELRAAGSGSPVSEIATLDRNTVLEIPVPRSAVPRKTEFDLVIPTGRIRDVADNLFVGIDPVGAPCNSRTNELPNGIPRDQHHGSLLVYTQNLTTAVLVQEAPCRALFGRGAEPSSTTPPDYTAKPP
jgi:hypothetical protein